MTADGPRFYDDEAVFARYAPAPVHADSANDTLEAPVIDELVGDVTAARVVELGCGDAAYGARVLALGGRELHRHRGFRPHGSGRAGIPRPHARRGTADTPNPAATLIR